jgi:hypothetical protein
MSFPEFEAFGKAYKDPYENAIAERVNGILKDEFDLAGL